MRLVISLLLGLIIGFGIGWLVGSYSSTSISVTNDPNSGRFLSQPETVLLPNGRDIKLLKEFVFIDSRGRSWVADKGTVANGASIPKFLWSITGGPLTGKFRNASIVHDVECERMTSPSTDVHRMFYDACRAGGVGEGKAKYLYWAVANYGPTWETRTAFTVAGPQNLEGASLKSVPTVVTRKLEVKSPTEVELEWAKKFFDEKNPPIDRVPFLEPPRDEGGGPDLGDVPGV